MSQDLTAELQKAQDRVAQLRAEIAAGPCREFGHDWRSLGGCNAGCEIDGCSCSVPVNECSKCGDCDYGDNAEADEIRRQCAEDAA